MFFWITVVAGILTGLLGLRLRWFESMALLFNLLIGIYLGLYATPYLSALVPMALEIPYGMPLTALGVTLVSFGILQTITYLLITGQFSVYFPKLLDYLGGGICGFMAGFLVLSFAVTLMKVQSQTNTEHLLPKEVSVQANVLEWWTGKIHCFAGKKGTSMTDALNDLNELVQSSSTPAPSDPNESTTTQPSP